MNAQESTEASLEHASSSDALAVVLIHGIGDIVPGHVLGSSVTSLEKHFGIKTVSATQVSSVSRSFGLPGHATVRKAELRWLDRQIDLIEFNWTSLIGKIRLAHPIAAVRKFLGVLRDVPALGSIGATGSMDRALLSVTAWFYQAVFLVLLLTVLVTVGHELMRYEAYGAAMLKLDAQQQPAASSEEAAKQGYEHGVEILNVFERQESIFPDTIKAILWNVVFALIVPVFILPAYVIVRILQFQPRCALQVLLAAGLGWVLLVLSFWSLMMAGMFAFQLGLGLTEHQAGLWERLARGMIFALLFFWVPAKVIAIVGNLIRDVVHYLAPDRRGALTPDQIAVRTELWQLIDGLKAEGKYERIILVAHSLGTVILTDLLLEKALSAGMGQPTPLDVVTAGSPLRRLRLFFPDRIPDLQSTRRQLADAPGVRVVRWFNAYRIADYVGQALTRSAFFLDLLGLRWVSGNPRTGIGDHLLTPRYRWPFAHANYWGDTRFLRFVALDILRPLLDSSRKPPMTSDTLPAL